MPFIPHTAEEESAMLSEIGVDSIEDLFDEIPSGLRASTLDDVPAGVSEMEMLRLLGERAAADHPGVCFLGAGCYDHHIPSAVWDLTARGEFMTAYTPYQAEASQGTLQLIYEYQTMMTRLTGMDVSNARVVLLPESVHPNYRQATRSIVRNQGVETATIPITEDGRIDRPALEQHEDAVALVVQQPNFFGMLEDVDELTDWASERGILLVALVNPLTLAVLNPPGEWGKAGADICCGDGQPFGIPMSSGGPSFGFLCCRSAFVRQMPGRIIGRTLDLDGRTGFTLTLQAREQHIRRGKATSNICTNQGLLVTAATIHMSLMGSDGIRAAALSSAAHTRELVQALTAIDGVHEKFSGPYFHERVLTLPQRADEVVDRLLDHGFLGGMALGPHYPDMDRCLLVCATEKRTSEEIERFALALKECLAS